MNETNIQKQLAKLRRNKKFLWVGILFLVLIILWILTSIFATTKTSSISQELRELSKPFVPRLESKTFEEILAKRAFSQKELDGFSIFIIDKNNVESNELIIDIMAPPEAIEDASVLDPVISPTPAIVSPTIVSPTIDSSTTTPFIEFMKANY